MSGGTRPPSPRQAEVVERRLSDEPQKSIAADLGISEGSVKRHQERGLRKLGVGDLDEARELVAPELSSSGGRGDLEEIRLMGGVFLTHEDVLELLDARAQSIRAAARQTGVIARAVARARKVRTDK